MRSRSYIPWAYLVVVALGVAFVAWFRTIPGDDAVKPSERAAPNDEAAPAFDASLPLTGTEDSLARTPAASTELVEPTPSLDTVAAKPACTITGRCIDAGGRPI